MDTSISRDKSLLYADLSRRDIRALMFYLFYALESFDYQISTKEIIENFNYGFSLDIPLDSEVAKTVESIVKQKDALDESFKDLLANWRLDRISVSSLLIIRLGVWELSHSKTDSRIVINEAIELAKCFAEDDAYRLINGLLDRYAKDQGDRTDNYS
jgi:N utilization substance protein B